MKLKIILLILLMEFKKLNGELVKPRSDDLQLKNNLKNETVAENLKKQFEEFKNRMCYKIPKLKINVILEPFITEYLAIDNFDEVDIQFLNMNVIGLSNITIKNLNVNLTDNTEITVNFELKEAFYLNTNYTIIGKIPNLFNINGTGKISSAMNLNITLKFRLLGCKNSKKPYLIIKNMEPKLGFKHFDITGLFSDYELNQFVKDMVHDIGTDILNDIWMDYNKIVIIFLQLNSSEYAKILCGIIDENKPVFGSDDPPDDCKSKF